MQYKHGSAAVESELKLMEHQFRDAEMALTMAEMRPTSTLRPGQMRQNAGSPPRAAR